MADLARPSGSLERGHLKFEIGTVQDDCGAAAASNYSNLDLAFNAMS